jgi:PTH1 family peptidyl-tRNA hydrolase
VYALIGLGNPGNRYIDTRHNVGYMIADHFLETQNIPFRPGKGDYYYNELEVDGQQTFVFKPTTYMNNSGRAVKRIIEHFSFSLEKLLVICDDFNLPFGAFRFRQKGSDGGHNGLKSIIYQLQTEDFNRFRFGIGDAFSDASYFVLESFSRKESEKLNELLPISTEAIHHWLDKGIQETMNKFNRQFISENR